MAKRQVPVRVLDDMLDTMGDAHTRHPEAELLFEASGSMGVDKTGELDLGASGSASVPVSGVPVDASAKAGYKRERNVTRTGEWYLRVAFNRRD